MKKSKIVTTVFIACLGILVIGLALPAFFLPRGGHGHQVVKTKNRLSEVAMAAQSYRMQYGEWPMGFSDFTNNPHNLHFFDLRHDGIRDGWHNPISLQISNPTADVGVVISFGRDGKPGGRGKNRDILIRFDESERTLTTN